MQRNIKTIIILLLLSAAFSNTFAQSHLSTQEISINGFRSPSIGAEYRYKAISIHTGYYLTAFKAGETTNFVKTGVTVWFLPVGAKENPSSFFAGASYMRGLNRDYKSKNAIGIDAGYRWMVWRGLNLRIGAIAAAAKSQSLKVNPAGGISYSFFIR